MAMSILPPVPEAKAVLLEHFVFSQIRLFEVITSQLQVWSAWPALCWPWHKVYPSKYS